MAFKKTRQYGRISVMRAGFSLGLLFAVMQIAWGLLLLATGGSAVAHMYSLDMLGSAAPVYAGFDLVIYLVGVVVSYAIGFACGALFAFIWNSLKD